MITRARCAALPISLTPAQAAARCAHLPGFVFFDSARSEERAAEQWSLLASHPGEVLRGVNEAVWQRLRECLLVRETTALRSGVAAGWVEYDGALCFGLYDGLLAYHHGREEWELWGAPEAAAPLLEALQEAAPEAERPTPRFQPDLTRGDYLRMVARAQEYIAAGDIYQVNVTHRFAAAWEPGWSPYAFYTALREASPAPYAAYLTLGGRFVLSSSPELFLKLDGRTIETRPIKGTRPRGGSPLEDERNACDLCSSPKETAELVMITDLERNDLGQICTYGSVSVTDLLKLERYRQVFHLVSTVRGELREGVDPVSALRACFPGGSITGAPKKRAREIIAELEPAPRGLYTGAIGYFGFNGQSCFNIAIRTVVVEGGEAHFHAGAGIVADSIPQAEWDETLHKAKGILLAAQGGKG